MNTPNTEKRDVRSVYAEGGTEALRTAPTVEWTPKFTSHTSTGHNWSGASLVLPPDEGPFSHSIKKLKPFTKYLPNDIGNSELFADRYGDRLKHSPGIGWLVWDGSIWLPDAAGRVTGLAGELTHQTFKEAAEIVDADARAAAGRRALKLGDRRAITSLMELAKSRVHVDPLELDADPLLVGCKNGVINLRTGAFHKPNRDDLITKSLGASFDASARCPRWERFVSEIMLGDVEMVDYLQRAVGYSMTGEVKEQCFFFLYGHGSNGKSVFIETIRSLMGSYSARSSRTLLESSHNGRSEDKSDLARLPGVRLLCASETSQKGTFNESILKDLTGGESVNARMIYQTAFDFEPRCKIWIAGNHQPRIDGVDYGIWRRVRLIPFEATFTDETKDPGLALALRREMSGILNWCIAGAVRWNSDGLGLPEKVRLAVSNYKEDQDILGDFVSERLETVIGFSVKKSEVYQAYVRWCGENGLKHPLSAKRFTSALKQRDMIDDNSKYWRSTRLATIELP